MPRPRQSDPQVITSFQAPVKVIDFAKKIAEKRGIPVSQLVRSALIAYLRIEATKLKAEAEARKSSSAA
jgi:hypothetical protein